MVQVTITGTRDELSSLLSLLVYDKNRQLDRIEAKLDSVITQETQMKVNIDGLIAAVAAETTVDKSVLALVNQVIGQNTQISKDLAQAIADNDPVAIAAIQKAIDDNVATMTQNAALIQKAVTDNVPPPPPAV